MSDDTEETYSRDSSFLQKLVRKVVFFIGIALIAWILVAKNFPQIISPRVGSQTTPKDMDKRAESIEQKRRMAEAMRSNPRPAQQADAPAATPAPEGEVAQLRQRVDEMEARMKQYEGKLQLPVQGEQTAPQPQGLNETDKQRMAQLEEQLTRQQDVLAAMKTQFGEQENVSRERSVQMEEQLKNQHAVIVALKEQIETLQAHGARKLTAITAFGFMKEAIQRGEPFAGPLQQLDQQIQDAKIKALVTQLAPHADKGAMTLPALKSEFGTALTSALSGARKDNSFALNLQSLIRIRKVGEQQKGTDDESILARAEAKLERSEIGASLQEIATLSPAAADAFAAWVKNADAFVQVRRLTDTLQLAIVQGADAIKSAAPVPEAVVQTPVSSTPVAEPKEEPAPEPEAKTAVKTEPEPESKAESPATAEDAPETPSEPTESE